MEQGRPEPRSGPRLGIAAMQSQNRFFDDLARVASGALGTLSGVREEVEQRLREQLEKLLAGMDLVSREEFEAVRAMAAKARNEQEELKQRLAALEARLGGPPTAPGEDGSGAAAPQGEPQSQ
jgi:BMFP domain-containing protein YqiC